MLVLISYVFTSNPALSSGSKSAETIPCAANSKPSALLFTLTTLPAPPEKLAGVSVSPAKLPAGVDTVTNSTASPAEFYFKCFTRCIFQS